MSSDMLIAIDVVVQAARLALFTLLPILVAMNVLELVARRGGVFQRAERFFDRPLRAVGLSGTGLVALFQVLLISFAAPRETLSGVAADGTSRRRMAALLAAVLTAAQANATFPLIVDGLSPWVVPIALCGSLAASASTYYVFCRTDAARPVLPRAENTCQSLAEAALRGATSAVKAIPYLLVGLALSRGLEAVGFVDWVRSGIAPFLDRMRLPEAAATAITTKFAAGGTAMLAVTHELVVKGMLSVAELNRLAGFISPLDVVGAPILVGAVPRWPTVVGPALLGSSVGLALRAVVHASVF